MYYYSIVETRQRFNHISGKQDRGWTFCEEDMVEVVLFGSGDKKEV